MKTSRNNSQAQLTNQVSYPSIEYIALLSKFNQEQLPAIMDIIGATPNPRVAIETLLDIYQQPVFSSQVQNRDQSTVYDYESYCKWNDTIRYSYLRKQRIECTIPDEMGTDELTADNYQDFPYKWNKSEHRTVTVYFDSVLETAYDTMSAESWIELDKKSNFQLAA